LFSASFIRNLVTRLNYIKLGSSLLDKLKIFVYIINPFPKLLRNRSRILEGIASLFVETLKGATVRVNGIKYLLVDEQSLFILAPTYETWIKNYLRPKEGEVFLDVGAHIGKYALQIAKVVGEKGLVIAVEPNPENHRILLRNIELNNFGNIIPVRVAAWNKECKLKLFRDSRHAASSVMIDWGSGYIEADARPLDKVLKELNITRLDWVKIDVEEAEYEVLQGLRNSIRRYKNAKIITDIPDKNKRKMVDFMRKLGRRAFPAVGSEGRDFYFARKIPPISA
jgi:FkbM family methyltransferase